MAKVTTLTELAVNTEANAFASLMDGGFIDMFDGTPPANADVVLRGQQPGISLAFGTPAFGKAIAGVIVANSISPGVATRTLNPVKWARIYKADHRTVVMDVSVGTRDAVIVLPTDVIAAGVTVTCSHFSHKVASSAA